MSCSGIRWRINRTLTSGTLDEVRQMASDGTSWDHLFDFEMGMITAGRPDAIDRIEVVAQALDENMGPAVELWYATVFSAALTYPTSQQTLLSYLLWEHPLLLNYVKPIDLYTAASGINFWPLVSWRHDLAAYVTGRTVRDIGWVVEVVEESLRPVLSLDLTRYVLQAV